MNEHLYQSSHRFRKTETQPEKYCRYYNNSQYYGSDNKYYADDGERTGWHERENKHQRDTAAERANCEKLEEECVQMRINEAKFRHVAGCLNTANSVQELAIKIQCIDQRYVDANEAQQRNEQELRLKIQSANSRNGPIV